MASFGNIIAKLKIPSLGFVKSWNDSEARNSTSWRGRHSSKYFEGGPILELQHFKSSSRLKTTFLIASKELMNIDLHMWNEASTSFVCCYGTL
jgi:hypothetical protein